MTTPSIWMFVCFLYMLMLYTNSMRILLTEGAGLTSRQVATQLDQRRHEVAALISDPLCLARFTRHLESLPARSAVWRGSTGLV